ncbi:MAG TPA: tRNA (N6-threonylcarbamoyladenosine(37)-N6)-methyltransferase TrmO, partial [Dehalococcoidia bacterium]
CRKMGRGRQEVRVFRWVRERLGQGRAALPDLAPVTLEPIGWVRNGVRRPSRTRDWRAVRSELVLREELAEALLGLEAYSHVLVLTWLHLVGPEERRLRRIHPQGDARYPLQGVLALRTPARPNPIGVTAARLLAVRGTVLEVAGLDAVHGTPVLDVKPYLPQYDAVPEARTPDWGRRARPDGGKSHA